MFITAVQVPDTCPYPEPVQSSPCPQSHFMTIFFFKYCPPTYAWVFKFVYFPQVSPPKFSIHLSSLPYVLHAPPSRSSSRMIIHSFNDHSEMLRGKTLKNQSNLNYVERFKSHGIVNPYRLGYKNKWVNSVQRNISCWF